MATQPLPELGINPVDDCHADSVLIEQRCFCNACGEAISDVPESDRVCATCHRAPSSVTSDLWLS